MQKSPANCFPIQLTAGCGQLQRSASDYCFRFGGRLVDADADIGGGLQKRTAGSRRQKRLADAVIRSGS